jgi:hypothetical protein
VRKRLSLSVLGWVLVVGCTSSPLALPQGRFQIIGGRNLTDAIPRDFYLEGSAMRVEKRNAVLIKTPSGARVLVALLVTSGFASRLPHKYVGMLISEGPVALCGSGLSVGSYGFGLRRLPDRNARDAEFLLYNQAGEEIGGCAAKKDLRLKEPRPLQATIAAPGSARLYFGRYWVELEP